jgi:hypothetical protein
MSILASSYFLPSNHFAQIKIETSVMSVQKPLKLIEELSAQHKFCQGRNDGICQGRSSPPAGSVKMIRAVDRLVTGLFKLNVRWNPLFPAFYLSALKAGEPGRYRPGS